MLLGARTKRSYIIELSFLVWLVIMINIRLCIDTRTHLVHTAPVKRILNFLLFFKTGIRSEMHNVDGDKLG